MNYFKTYTTNFCVMIKKTKSGYQLVSKKTGKPLSKPNISKTAAEKREKQVNYFKHKGK